jgi:hypothetical protein
MDSVNRGVRARYLAVIDRNPDAVKEALKAA